MSMTNTEKFLAMGLHHLPKGRKVKVLVNELDLLDETKVYLIKNLVNPFGTTSDPSFHNANTCLAVQEVIGFTGGEVEIHYSNDSWKNAIKYAKENNIKVIGRSASFSFLGEEDEKIMQDFIDWGGIFIASAGNDRNKDNAPTDVVNKYFISVGCVFEPDNSESTVVVYSSLKLPSFEEGVSNTYTDTSGAQPQVLVVAAIMQSVYGMNKYQFEKWLIANGITNVPNLEVGERLMYVPVLEKVELCRFKIGSTTALVKGQIITLDQAPVVDEDTDRTLMPVRAVLEALGYTVKWNQATQEISVY